jgi:hypothetical protein
MPSPGIVATYRRRRSVPAARERGCRKATMVRDYLFLRQTQVAKYFNRTRSVTGRLHSPLVFSVAQVPAIASLHARSVFISAVPPRSTSVLCRLGPHSPLWATSASETRIRLLLFNRLSRHVAWRQQFGSSNRSGGPRSCHNRRLQPKTALSGSSPGRRTKPDGRLRVDSGPARCARRRRSSATMPAPLGRAQAPRSLRPYTEARAATASSIVAA